MSQKRHKVLRVLDVMSGLLGLVFVALVIYRSLHGLDVLPYVMGLCAWAVIGALKLITGSEYRGDER